MWVAFVGDGRNRELKKSKNKIRYAAMGLMDIIVFDDTKKRECRANFKNKKANL